MSRRINFSVVLLCLAIQKVVNISLPNNSLLKFDILSYTGQVDDKKSLLTSNLNLHPNLGLTDVFEKLFPSEDIPSLTISLPHSEKYISKQFHSATLNNDRNLNFVQLAQKYGYEILEYQVQTSDGYILKLFRIPRNGTVALLMHGLLGSAYDWVLTGPESGIAYLLASEGYDVWLGNARGNKYSRRHIRLSPDSNDATNFWDFSWHEIGYYDLPAMIDLVLSESGKTTLKYVGHSQGTTAFFVLCSTRPEYNNKISLMVALSAVAWMSHVKSPIVRLFSTVNPILRFVTELFNVYEFLPSNQLMKHLQAILCGKKILAEILCSNIMFLFGGFNADQLNVTNLPVIFSHVPSGASVKQFIHYGQNIQSAKFARYNNGEVKNRKIYGSKDPPEYPVQKITVPVAIFYSENDWLADVADVDVLCKKLTNIIDLYKVPDKHFNHLDFLWSKDVKTLIFYKLLELFEFNISTKPIK